MFSRGSKPRRLSVAPQSMADVCCFQRVLATLAYMKPAQRPVYQRPLRRALAVLLGASLLAYPADWLLWRVRSLAGGGMGAVVVSESLAATLKGNHFEVYAPTVGTVACSRSLLPQAGAGACWWLQRHTDQITQY